MLKSFYSGCIYPENVSVRVLPNEPIGIFDGNLGFSVRLSASLAALGMIKGKIAYPIPPRPLMQAR
jgi:hypothetical protein